MNIYVGNIPYSTTDADLETWFSEFGSVTSAKIIIDRESGRSKGFGFVEMEDDDDARNAISQLDAKEMNGRNLKVNEAKPKTTRDRDSRPPRRPRY